MAIKNNKKTETTATATATTSVEFVRARKLGETSKGGDVIALDFKANGVSIYGAKLVEYQNKNGDVDYMLTFPQTKGKNGEYYDVCWCPISREARQTLVADALKAITEV